VCRPVRTAHANRYGLVPNGGRVYYLKRSHPPMFFRMVNKFWQERRDERAFVFSLLPAMERELTFWLRNRSSTYMLGAQYGHKRPVPVFHFDSQTTAPRPESYSIDVETVAAANESTKCGFPPQLTPLRSGDKPMLYSNIAAGAETGWDFTSRFLADKLHLNRSFTKRIWPVDLNAYMCENYRILAELFKAQGDLVVHVDCTVS